MKLVFVCKLEAALMCRLHTTARPVATELLEILELVLKIVGRNGMMVYS